jgi:hypothetical protein
MPRILSALRVAVAITSVGSACAPASAQSAAGVGGLSWLAGCWSSEGKEAGSGEQWMQPVAGTMLGMARTVKSGKTVEYEFMRIHQAPDGRLLFTAIPSGQKEATFTQLSMSESEIVFENAAHDFPQRVIYRRKGEAQLVASIEGTRNGTLRTIDFAMTRSACLL